MNRVLTLGWFYLKELFRSLAVVGPLAITLALYWLFFEYPGDVDYFVAVGGFTLLAVALMAVLTMASQVNTASSAIPLSRLPDRAELLAALVAAGLVVSGMMAALFTALVLAQGKVEIDLLDLAAITPRWLALALVANTAALLLTRLVSRNGSYLVALTLLAVVATAVDQRSRLLDTPFGWLAQGINLVAWPITANLTAPVLPLEPVRFLLALSLAVAYAGLGFGLAARLFEGKDLLWMD